MIKLHQGIDEAVGLWWNGVPLETHLNDETYGPSVKLSLVPTLDAPPL